MLPNDVKHSGTCTFTRIRCHSSYSVDAASQKLGVIEVPLYRYYVYNDYVCSVLALNLPTLHYYYIKPICLGTSYNNTLCVNFMIRM